VIFRRRRFAELVGRQLDLFAEDEAELLREAQEQRDEYDRAGRADAEETYGDYLLALEAVADRLAGLRSTYAATLDEDAAGEYEAAFERAVRKRFPELPGA
jgi:hypothetical protein